MDTLYIVIPAYNESENIKRTIEECVPSWRSITAAVRPVL